MTTLQEQLGIIQAAIDGKEIEFYTSIDKEWRTKNTAINKEFDFICIKYRIKPEPKKEIKLHQYLIKNIDANCYITSQRFYPNLESCIKDYKNLENIQVIKAIPHTEITITED